MLIEIKSRWDGHVIFSVEARSLKAAVEIAVKQRANLYGANLSGADLYGANLYGANLAGAKNISKYLTTPLLILLDQPGPIRAYKIVTAEGEGIYSQLNGYRPINYLAAETFEFPDADSDDTKQCAAGGNLATLDWCIKEWKPGYRILVMEFTAADIAAIPTATDGKFRVRRCRRVGEKDLKEIGLSVTEEAVDG